MLPGRVSSRCLTADVALSDCALVLTGEGSGLLASARLAGICAGGGERRDLCTLSSPRLLGLATQVVVQQWRAARGRPCLDTVSGSTRPLLAPSTACDTMALFPKGSLPSSLFPLVRGHPLGCPTCGHRNLPRALPGGKGLPPTLVSLLSMFKHPSCQFFGSSLCSALANLTGPCWGDEGEHLGGRAPAAHCWVRRLLDLHPARIAAAARCSGLGAVPV